ncbi:hypothetical protein [Stenotrophomonas sp.]|uniref:hypothetical protein n=1 Tax=Stenotrophomonas sp. TaxID=69392 RepID=UPI00289DF333|nr:hypothetical protein [Stenotrophomonas sp.]
MLRLAMFRCDNAKDLWKPRLDLALRGNDREGVELAIAILGKRHPTEATRSEAAENREQTEPLSGGVEAQPPPLPATPAPCSQIGSSHSRHEYPQHPSISKFLEERTFLKPPLQAFLKSMMGNSAA